MSEHDRADKTFDTAEVWVRFMAAALSAAPHAPADKVAVTADEALAEYQRRVVADRFEPVGAEVPTAASGATATPFEPRIVRDQVAYDPTAEAPSEEEVDSPFKPPSE